MRLKLEKRANPSRLMMVVTPIASVLVTMAVGVVVFDLIKIDGVRASPTCSSRRCLRATSGRTWRCALRRW